MTFKSAELAGQEIPNTRIHVLRNTGRLNKRKEVLWECRCTCGNPETFEASTSALLRGEKMSCGCLKGRKVECDHNNRDCREAVLLALYWARRWGTDVYVQHGHERGRYVIHAHPSGCKYQIGYRITPKGQVTHFEGYPDYPTLFGRKEDRIYLQFRLRNGGGRDAWTTCRNAHVFYAHQRDLAQAEAEKLALERPDMEYRIKPNDEEE